MKRTPLRTDPEKLRAWQDRSRKPIPTHTPLKSKKRVNPVNRERRAKRREIEFGDKRDFTINSRCRTCGAPPPSEPSHALKSRGAGGTAYHLLPQCNSCHRLLHAEGVETFQRLKGVDLERLTKEFDDEWQEYRKKFPTGKGSDLAY